MESPDKVLLIGQSKDSYRLIHSLVSDWLPGSLKMAETQEEVSSLLDSDGERYLMAIIDIVDPEQADKEILDILGDHELPTVALTENMDRAKLRQFYELELLDYIDAKRPSAVGYLDSLMRRMKKNLNTKVLVVDDSITYRMMLRDILESYLFEVIEAKDGVEALTVFEDNPDTRLVVVDQEMPKMDGLTLITHLREIRNSEQLAIIGISGADWDDLMFTFIKYGANDVMSKPVRADEFIVRVNEAMNRMDLLGALWERATRDFLTGLSNRRHFFELAERFFAGARRTNQNLAVAMIDLDYFKKVNDTYGHDAGDAVLKAMAETLMERFRKSDVVARMGGEEFCVLAVNPHPDFVEEIFEKLRAKVEEMVIEFQDIEIRVTSSIGVCASVLDNLDAMIAAADAALYEAKNSGRNRVVIVRP